MQRTPSSSSSSSRAMPLVDRTCASSRSSRGQFGDAVARVRPGRCAWRRRARAADRRGRKQLAHRRSDAAARGRRWRAPPACRSVRCTSARCNDFVALAHRQFTGWWVSGWARASGQRGLTHVETRLPRCRVPAGACPGGSCPLAGGPRAADVRSLGCGAPSTDADPERSRDLLQRHRIRGTRPALQQVEGPLETWIVGFDFGVRS